MKLTRRSLLGALGALPFARPFAARADQGAARNLVVVMASGGWDTTYLFDPKPDSPFVNTGTGHYGAFGQHALWLDASRPSVTQFFQRYGAISSVVNGVNVPSVAHDSCTNRVLTGFRDMHRPDVAAIAAHELGQDSPLPYLDVGGAAFPGAFGADLGFMGDSNQLGRLVLDELAYPPVNEPWRRHFADDAQADLMRQFVEARASREASGRAAMGVNSRRLADFTRGLERSHRLPDFEDFFEGVGTDRGLDRQVGVAVEALSIGLSRAVMLDSGFGFDTHADNADQSQLLEGTFTGLLALMELLEQTPSPGGGSLIDDTIVLVLSEMGRTPLLNDDAGKDHWPFTSCLVAGACVRGEQVVGATDDTLVGVPVSFDDGLPSESGGLLHAENVLAGVLDLLGARPELHLPDAEVLRALRA